MIANQLAAVIENLGPDASEGDIVAALRDAGALDWPRESSASTLLDLYNDLSDSRRGDLWECAQVIALAP